MSIEFVRGDIPPGDLDEFFEGDFGIFADGVRCVSIRFDDPGWSDYGDHVSMTVVLGRLDQPPECRSEGAAVRFGDGGARWLFVTETLRLDTSAIVENYAPEPPSTGSPGAPGTGSLGPVARSTTGALYAVLLALAVVVLVGGGRVATR